MPCLRQAFRHEPYLLAYHQTPIGANGQIGQQFLNIALQNGDKVKAVVRRAGALEMTHHNLEVIVANYNDEAQVTKAIEGQDTVVSTLGPNLNGGRKITKTVIFILISSNKFCISNICCTLIIS